MPCWISCQIKAPTLPRRSLSDNWLPPLGSPAEVLVSFFLCAPSLTPWLRTYTKFWSKHNNPRNEDHQWSKSLWCIKDTFFLSPEVKTVTGYRIFMRGWNCKINLWLTALLCFLQRISWLKLRAVSLSSSWSCSQLCFSFVELPDMPNTFLLNLCSHFNVYSILSPYADFFCFPGQPRRWPVYAVCTKLTREPASATTKQKENVATIKSIIFGVYKSWDFL